MKMAILAEISISFRGFCNLLLSICPVIVVFTMLSDQFHQRLSIKFKWCGHHISETNKALTIRSLQNFVSIVFHICNNHLLHYNNEWNMARKMATWHENGKYNLTNFVINMHLKKFLSWTEKSLRAKFQWAASKFIITLLRASLRYQYHSHMWNVNHLIIF